MLFANLSRTFNSFSFIAVVVLVLALLTSVAFPAESTRGGHVKGEILVKPRVGLRTTTSSGGNASVSGTSFSEPATAATIAMIMSVDSRLKPAEIETILVDSAEDLGAPVRDDQYGHGRIDTLATVQLAGGQQ